MWKKSIVLLLLACLSCCSLSPAFSQSATPATWDSFDQTLTQLKSEIDNLSTQLQKAQESLMVSIFDLNTLKVKLQERQTQYSALESLYLQSKQSALNSENSLRSVRKGLVVSIVVNVALVAATAFLILH